MMEQQVQQVQQKRSAAEAESLLVGVKAIVLDIEGTTTSITFEKEKLIPYAHNNVEQHLTETFEEAETIKDVKALRELAVKHKADNVEGVVEIPEPSCSKEDVIKAVAASVRWHLDCERECTELRQFLNHLWRQGFESGQLVVEMFEDVPPMLRMLSEEGFALYVYAAGTVEWHKLLFANTTDGDLTEVFTNFFDTSIGAKTDSESYKKISAEVGQELKCTADQILYLTDLPEEGEAANASGLRCALVIRPGNADLTDEHLQNFACIEQLDELYGDEDEEDFKRMHGEDNGEPVDDEDDDDDEVDEDDEGEEEEGEGDDA